MLVGCIGVLMTATAFVSDVPPLVQDRLTATNETHGTFVQTKRLPTGEEFVSSGRWRIRPGIDFEWRISDPFDALFWADQAKYIYSNEDEFVEKPLDELTGFEHFKDARTGDFSAFFKAFDALYKEDSDGFHVLAKPKDARLTRFLTRVEADGVPTNWTFRATFPDRTTFDVKIDEHPR